MSGRFASRLGLLRQIGAYLAIPSGRESRHCALRASLRQGLAQYFPTRASLTAAVTVLSFSSVSHAENSSSASPSSIFQSHLHRKGSQCPSPRLSAALAAAASACAYLRAAPATGEAPACPVGIDHTLLELRCLSDEAAEAARDEPVESSLSRANTLLEAFQLRQRARVNKYVDALLPDAGLRGRLFAAARARREEANATAVEELRSRGATPRQVYSLLWEQQWRRRENISKMAGIAGGNGVLRFFVNYVAGVPQPVLELARGLNEDGGPTAVLRAMFREEMLELLGAGEQIRDLARRLEAEKAAGSRGEDRYAGSGVERIRIGRLALREAAQAYASDVEAFLCRLEAVVIESGLFDAPLPSDAVVANVAIEVSPLSDCPPK